MKPLMPDRAVARKLLLLQKNRQYKVKADRENSLSVCFFVCPVPSGLPHRSHCVPININRCGYRVLLELLGRFELPTSSLPILLRLFCLILSCFVLKPETLAAQGFQAFLFCVLVSLILFLRMGFFDARMGFVWVLQRSIRGSSLTHLTHLF